MMDVNRWLHQQSQVDQSKVSLTDQWGINWDLYGQYEKYPLKHFQFKCLKDKDPSTWPLPDLDEGSVVSTECGSICNVQRCK